MPAPCCVVWPIHPDAAGGPAVHVKGCGDQFDSFALKGCGDQFNNCFKGCGGGGCGGGVAVSIQTGDQEVPGSNPR